MRILVAHASRMGGTAEIAERVGRRLREAGFEVDVHACADAPAATEYDAIIVGSALYTRRWERAAVDYLKANTAGLGARPTWLFHSGPCGDGAEDQSVPVGGTVPTPQRSNRGVSPHHLRRPARSGPCHHPDTALDDQRLIRR